MVPVVEVVDVVVVDVVEVVCNKSQRVSGHGEMEQGLRLWCLLWMW